MSEDQRNLVSHAEAPTQPAKRARQIRRAGYK
jgi:hypothetical protein